MYYCQEILKKFMWDREGHHNNLYKVQHLNSIPGEPVRCALNRVKYLQFTLDVIDFDCELVDLKLTANNTNKPKVPSCAARPALRHSD